MKDSSFIFLQSSYPELYTLTELAEKLVGIDPNSSLTKARLFVEKLILLIGEFERYEFSPKDTPNIRINKLHTANVFPDTVKTLLDTIRIAGNNATHNGDRTEREARYILKKLFKLSKWFYETYEGEDLGSIKYEPQEYASSEDEISQLNQQLAELQEKIVNYEDKIAQLNISEKAIRQRQRRSSKVAKKITFDEKETRKELIDPALRKAGWECDSELLSYERHKTMPQKGRNMAIAEWPCGRKQADYALFIGTTLYAVIEAKKFSSDISTDLHQSKRYALNLRTQEGIQLLGDWDGHKVPFLFSTNGREYLEQIKTKSGIWFADTRYLSKRAEPLRAWYSPEGLKDLYERNIESINENLQNSDISYLTDKNGLSLRNYQINAIKAVEDVILRGEKRALLVMATGTGKTRVAVGLSYRLIKSNRFRRILFLTDRRTLAEQAGDDFDDYKIENFNTFADIYKINKLGKQDTEIETRIQFATVQSMVKRLFYATDEKKNQLSIDTYDCIIVDEAHRGYNEDKQLNEEDLSFRDQADYVGQYKRVIEYFDAFVIGLTATPALHTTNIFGAPIFTYSYREAVIDGNLVDHEPPYQIKTKLNTEGIKWKKGERPKVYNPENNTIEELAALEDELKFDVESFNKAVITSPFNRTIIQELVNYIDPQSEEKTLIFAVNDEHADTIVNLLFEEYNEIGVDVPQDAIKKITGKAYNPQELVRLYKNEKFPNIAVTVDLLTTGVNVPAITNLVFMRCTNSRILFEQMLGRATRKCEDIGKECFRIFDAVGIYDKLKDFSQMQPVVSKPKIPFVQLVSEFDYIESDSRKRLQVEQIIAKLHRKKGLLDAEGQETFKQLAHNKTPNELATFLRKTELPKSIELIQELHELWVYLDSLKPQQDKMIYYSEHPDVVKETSRGYGKDNQKLEDYIESFKEFITENRNEIVALNVLYNKPTELDRKSLKELRMQLALNGFNETSLNIAWKKLTNKEIAADIITYIRTCAMGLPMETPEERVKRAIQKVKDMHPWSRIQLNWIDRFEKQLKAETLLKREDLDEEPFKDAGGYKKLNKIFNDQLDEVLETINTYLLGA